MGRAITPVELIDLFSCRFGGHIGPGIAQVTIFPQTGCAKPKVYLITKQ